MGRELAKDVYYSSRHYSPESVFTCGGYVFLAEVFIEENQADFALAMMDKVVDIWYKYLASLKTSQPTQSIDSTQSDVLESMQLAHSIRPHARPDNEEGQLPDTVVVEVKLLRKDTHAGHAGPECPSQNAVLRVGSPRGKKC